MAVRSQALASIGAAMTMMAACSAAPGTTTARPGNAPRPRPSARAAASSVADASAASVYIPADPEAHAALLADRADALVMSNPFTAFVAAPPSPHPRWATALKQNPKSLGAAADLRVAGYTYNSGSSDGEDLLVESDGSFVGSAQRKSHVLTPDQTAELLDLVAKATSPESNGAVISSRCDFDAHHGFLVFAKDGSLVREIEVCFECGELRVSPRARKNAEPVVLHHDTEEGFRRLCRAAGMPGCGHDEAMEERIDGDRRAFFATEEGKAWQASWIDYGDPSVDPRLALRDLDPLERTRMCLWFGAKIVRGSVGHGYECANGQTFQTLELGDCLTRFPVSGAAGEATVGETMACFGEGAYDPATMCQPMHGRRTSRCAEVIEDGLGIAPAAWQAPASKH